MRHYEYRHIVSFQETNLVGNVYYTNHLSWQGRCRELFLREHAPDVIDELRCRLSLATVSCSCEYSSELLAFDEIIVRMRLADLVQNRMRLEVGYNSLGTFSKTFNELVGVSPQEFRAMPKRLTAEQFARAIWRYLASRKKISGPRIEGVVEGPRRPRGFTFVGTFTRGVPLGVPFSGTVMAGRGIFCIERPEMEEFHLLAALVPLSASFTDLVANIPISLVASLRVQNGRSGSHERPRLRLRAVRPTDPPILLALPALPPLRGCGERGVTRVFRPAAGR